MELLIHGYKLVQTCQACPEQYEVFDSSGEQVGYLRLRHGHFTVEVPDVADTLVYEAEPEGDGIFETKERMYYLYRAINEIINHIANSETDW